MQTFQLTHSGPVATLQLTTKKGSMPPAFWGEFITALEQLSLSSDTCALIVRGPDCFSAGLDVQATLLRIIIETYHYKISNSHKLSKHVELVEKYVFKVIKYYKKQYVIKF